MIATASATPVLPRHRRHHGVNAGATRPSSILVRAARVINPVEESTEYTLELTTEEARKCLKFDALIVGDNERAIFVSAVARESDVERAGVVPGQRLRALTNPVDKTKLWIVSDAERLAFVKDAIRSTRQENITLVLEKEV